MSRRNAKRHQVIQLSENIPAVKPRGVGLRKEKNMSTSLVIMAAGLGSRYGESVKQLEAIGPNRESLMEYSVHDAVEAGFNRIIFIIRKEIEADFRKMVGDRLTRICAKRGVPVEYVFQCLNDLPEGFTFPEWRRKPWGTGAAVLACRDLLTEPFCVINADDYYGRDAFRKVHAFLEEAADGQHSASELCMAGFVLENTLSENGCVNRGICRMDKNNYLTKIVETKGIVRTKGGIVSTTYFPNGMIAHTALNGKLICSMNMWGMTPGFLQELENGFKEFLSGAGAINPEAEFLLPVFIGTLLEEDRISVKVFPTDDTWYGITYQEDTPAVRDAFWKMVSRGVYKRDLFSDWSNKRIGI